MAGKVDALFIFLLHRVGLCRCGHFLLIILFFAVKYRRRAGTSRRADRRLNPAGVDLVNCAAGNLSADFRLGRGASTSTSALPRRAPRSLCGRQAVDVEAASMKGPARDQRAARAGGPRREADHDLAGRDPQLLRAGFPHQAGRAAGALHHRLVPCHQAGNLSPVLRRVLRHPALGDDRAGRGDGAGAVSSLAGRRRGHRVHGRHRGSRFFSNWVLTCHRSDMQGRGPNLVGVFGKPVLLEDGRTVIADENYIRESHPSPRRKS